MRATPGKALTLVALLWPVALVAGVAGSLEGVITDAFENEQIPIFVADQQITQAVGIKVANHLTLTHAVGPISGVGVDGHLGEGVVGTRVLVDPEQGAAARSQVHFPAA
ncbi:MAG: hypothetical protein CME04_20805, partial [Gemmatimonadaceae bacterium]|nr:hypothetical protein [Gemmatimonadaceae bacterium]